MHYLIHNFGKLVDSLPCVIGIGTTVFCPEMAPLESVNWAKVTVGSVSEAEGVEVATGSVAVPDFYARCAQGQGGGGAADEPEEFGDDGTGEDAFGG